MARLPKRAANQSKHGAARPESSQLHAVEWMLSQRQYLNAANAADMLIQRFPNDSAPYRLRVEAEDALGRVGTALWIAWRWSQVRPNAAAPWREILRLGPAQLALLMADRAATRLREMGEETRGFPLTPEMIEELLVDQDGTRIPREAFERYEIGRMLLNAGEFAEAERALDGIEFQSAVNNRGLGLFQLSRVEEAAALLAENARRHPDNLFALGWAATLRLYLGDEEGARALGATLAEATPPRIDDSIVQVQTLLFLEMDQAAWPAWQRIGSLEGHGYLKDGTATNWRLMGGAAAARLGLREEALREWNAALAEGGGEPVRTNLDALSRHGEGPFYPEIVNLFSHLPEVTWILKASHKLADKEVFGNIRASLPYLRALYVSGDRLSRRCAAYAMRSRAVAGDGACRDQLFEFLRAPIGDDKLRFEIQGDLMQFGAMKRSDVVEMYLDGEIRQVRPFALTVSRGAKSYGLPEAVEARLQDGVECLTDGDARGAERHFRAVIKQAPDFPSARFNLASALWQRGEEEEADAIIQTLLTEFPDYLFARTTSAVKLLREGKPADARKLLDGLREREELHISEAFELYGTLALVAAMEGDEKEAKTNMDILQPLVQDERDRELYESWATRVSMGRRLKDSL